MKKSPAVLLVLLLLTPLFTIAQPDGKTVQDILSYFQKNDQIADSLRDHNAYADIIDIYNGELDYLTSRSETLGQYVSPLKVHLFYNLACIYSLQNNKDKAIQALDSVAAHGFSGFLNMATDSDFDNIRQEPGYKRICEAWKDKFDYMHVLRKCGPYRQNAKTDTLGTFTYRQPSDSALTHAREYFNLDSIAGDGDDISRIKNLMYWVHNNIPHDGNNGTAPGPRSLYNTYTSARNNNCGYNCRALAISLTEALLAEGIPSRYLTCLPKAWDTDMDCHVICVAWSTSLNKWIWVDPSFAAYVTDENGLLLHPGEVRYRLQNDLPLTLNEDANWNNKNQQTKEHYLDTYMAKNLYIIQANTVNQSNPENNSKNKQAIFATLIPEGANAPYSAITTSDDAWFWQSPAN